jgi:hypothetical protein
MSDSYSPSETVRLTGKFTPGATVTITITKLSDDSEVVTAAACTELDDSGYFEYEYDPADGADEYLSVMTDGIDEVAESFRVSGYSSTSSITGTWTFASDYTLVRDQIRSMIGDIDSNDPLISDEAIAFFYAQAGTATGGALRAAKAAAAKLAREFDKDIDGLSTSRSQRHKAMISIIEQLEKDVADEDAAENLSFTMPDASAEVADVDGYPVEFEPSDLGRPA